MIGAVGLGTSSAYVPNGAAAPTSPGCSCGQQPPCACARATGPLDGPLRSGATRPSSGEKVDPSDPRVRKLQQRDAEVRAHEAAHAGAAGGFAAGGPTFVYQQGPDGRLYAVGGEVQIDTTPVADNPEANLRKFEAILRAAHAPAEPSGADQAVAAAAAQQINASRQQIAQRRAAEAYGQAAQAPNEPGRVVSRAA